MKQWTDAECCDLIAVVCNGRNTNSLAGLIRAAVAEARREQRERDAEIAKECSHLHGDSVANAILAQEKEPTT